VVSNADHPCISSGAFILCLSLTGMELYLPTSALPCCWHNSSQRIAIHGNLQYPFEVPGLNFQPTETSAKRAIKI
jgi:hypothetical protein